MAVVLGGVEYVTTSEACERLAPDVTPETMRNWYAPRGQARPLLQVARDRQGVPLRLGGQYVFAWADVVEAEYQARTAGAGRPRARAGR